MSNLDWYKTRPIAHRGLHTGRSVPENSLRSFELSCEKKIPIEMDIHLLKDGNLVVFHDDHLKRMTGVDKSLYECDYQELANYRLYDTDEKIPLLSEALVAIKGRVPLNIEIKCPKHTGKLEQTLVDTLKSYNGEYVVQSFNPFTLIWFKNNAPAVPRGLLAGRLDDEDLPWWKKILLRNLVFVPQVKPDYIGYEWRYLSSAPVNFIRQFTDISILAWTIRSEEDYSQCRSLCDNIIFENFSPDSK